ncbi:hypothetical protein SprV_0301355500 [Sparganum proliferum]
MSFPRTNELRLTNLISGLTAFERIKTSLADATLLTHPAPEAPLSLMVDASTVAVGAVLQQHINDSTRPLAFFSKKLSLTETRYSTFGRELLAIYLAVKHFRHFLEGRDFTIFTDHKPLTFAIRSHSDKYNPREISHLDYISQFTTDIRHIDGPKNAVADMLSRPSLSAFHLSHGIDLGIMAAEQRRVGCPGDESVDNLQLVDVPLTTGSGTILCDVSTPFHRPYVPASMRRAVFSNSSRTLPSWDSSLTEAPRRKVQRHNKSPSGTFPSPDARFNHVHLDVVGPLPPSNGYTHLLTCVDRYTCWPEAIPLPNVQAETIVKAFFSRWVAIFGAPSMITTDRGAQFESTLFQTLLNFLGCTRIRTTAYHPAANGMVERFHRQLKTALRAAEDPENWSGNVPVALLGIRVALKSDLDCNAAELVSFPRTNELRLTNLINGESSPTDKQSMAILQCLTPNQLDRALDAGLSAGTPIGKLCQELEKLLKPAISKTEALNQLYSRRRRIGETANEFADELYRLCKSVYPSISQTDCSDAVLYHFIKYIEPPELRRSLLLQPPRDLKEAINRVNIYAKIPHNELSPQPSFRNFQGQNWRRYDNGNQNRSGPFNRPQYPKRDGYDQSYNRQRNVELWIARFEAEFEACDITRQETMFNRPQRSLPDEYAEDLCDLLIQRPSDQPYDKLKEALVKRVAMTEERRLRQLLTGEELGNRKPSQLLRRMQQLVGERKFETSILRQLFLQRLPLDVQTVLAVSRGSIEELAELADKVMALRVPETSAVSHVASPPL